MTEFPFASLVVMLPLLGALLCGVGPRKWTPTVAVLFSLMTVGSVGLLLGELARKGPVREPLGGWGAPLGIELYADGLAGLMLATTAIVALAVSVYSTGYFRGVRGRDDVEGAAFEGHHEGYFWSLWLVVWSGLNAVFLSSDLFNLYVCLEVMGLGSVALVALAGPLALRAAMRYLLITLCGSLLYLLGVALLYSGWGVLEIGLLAGLVEETAASRVALAVMTLGLALKTALVPLHFWLPAAHANAPAPVSAVLSALVVKASFFIFLRLWLDVFGALDKANLAVFLAILGTVAIVWGSVQALRQQRLKMLVAYSTVAQLGYLFVALAPASRDGGEAAWHGISYFIAAHACAKGAMFLAAGAIAAALGSDQLGAIRGHVAVLAIPLLAFALGGVSLMGLPPSGGYIAKWLFLTGTAATGQELTALVIQAGGLFAALYVFKVLYFAFLRAPELDEPAPTVQQAPRVLGLSALMLAIVAVVLGLVAAPPIDLLDIGRPFGETVVEGVEP